MRRLKAPALAAIVLLAVFALAYHVGTALSEDRPDPPCPKADEAVYQRFADTMMALAQNPLCEDLWERFRKSDNLATAKWIATRARQEGCW